MKGGEVTKSPMADYAPKDLPRMVYGSTRLTSREFCSAFCPRFYDLGVVYLIVGLDFILGQTMIADAALRHWIFKCPSSRDRMLVFSQHGLRKCMAPKLEMTEGQLDRSTTRTTRTLTVA
jgi:hypothetical protein